MDLKHQIYRKDPHAGAAQGKQKRPPNIRKQMNEITQSTLKKRLIHRSNSTM